MILENYLLPSSSSLAKYMTGYPFHCFQDDQENENPPAEETHLDRCNRGKHELVLEEDEGLICIFCQHVALGPKDIIPDWVRSLI